MSKQEIREIIDKMFEGFERKMDIISNEDQLIAKNHITFPIWINKKYYLGLFLYYDNPTIKFCHYYDISFNKDHEIFKEFDDFEQLLDELIIFKELILPKYL